MILSWAKTLFSAPTRTPSPSHDLFPSFVWSPVAALAVHRTSSSSKAVAECCSSLSAQGQYNFERRETLDSFLLPRLKLFQQAPPRFAVAGTGPKTQPGKSQARNSGASRPAPTCLASVVCPPSNHQPLSPVRRKSPLRSFRTERQPRAER